MIWRPRFVAHTRKSNEGGGENDCRPEHVQSGRAILRSFDLLEDETSSEDRVRGVADAARTCGRGESLDDVRMRKLVSKRLSAGIAGNPEKIEQEIQRTQHGKEQA